MLLAAFRTYLLFACFFYVLLAIGLLMARRKTQKQWLLIGLYTGLAAIVLSNFNTGPDYHFIYPRLIHVDLPGAFSVPVFTYLLTNLVFQRGYRLAGIRWLHLLVPTLVSIACIAVFLESDEDKITRILKARSGDYEWISLTTVFLIGPFYALVYFLASLKPIIKTLNPRLIMTERSVSLVWSAAFAILAMYIFVFAGLFLRDPFFFRISCGIVASAGFVYFLLAHRFPLILQNFLMVLDRVHYSTSVIDSIDLESLAARLRGLMTEGKLFQDPDLTLKSLATALEVRPDQLTQYLNERLGQNFATFVNSYRVQEACRLLLERPAMPVIRIAYDVGFNTKSSFNLAFKKILGRSPTSFRNTPPPRSENALKH